MTLSTWIEETKAICEKANNHPHAVGDSYDAGGLTNLGKLNIHAQTALPKALGIIERQSAWMKRAVEAFGCYWSDEQHGELQREYEKQMGLPQT